MNTFGIAEVMHRSLEPARQPIDLPQNPLLADRIGGAEQLRELAHSQLLQHPAQVFERDWIIQRRGA